MLAGWLVDLLVCWHAGLLLVLASFGEHFGVIVGISDPRRTNSSGENPALYKRSFAVKMKVYIVWLRRVRDGQRVLLHISGPPYVFEEIFDHDVLDWCFRIV